MRGDRESESDQFCANEIKQAGDDHEISICGKQRIAVNVDRNAADQAPRDAQALYQLNYGLEIVTATVRSQIVYFASGHEG